MRNIILLIAIVISSMSYAQDNDVTLSVDMNNYCGATINTLYVSGTFNSWSADANPMTDDDADGIYEVTLSLPVATDSILYKFQANEWAIQESFSPGDPCTETADGFTNRVLLFDADITVPTVCWNSCSACVSSGLEQIQLDIDWEGDVVDYTVSDFGENLSSIDEDPANSANTVLKTERSANAPTWAGTTLSTPCGFAEAMAFDIDNNVITVSVYSAEAGAIIRLKAEDHLDPTHSVETEATTTVAGEWEDLIFDFSNEATGTAAINYDYTYDMLSIFYNFGVDGATAGAQTYYCDDIIFGGNVPTPDGVTFRVDMNDYTEAFTSVYVSGDFNGWSGDANMMSDADADGVWELTLPLANDTIEYKYTLDNWAAQESLMSGSSCTVTNDGFTNRYLEISSDTLLSVVCWNSCVSCDEVPSNVDVTFKVDMNEYTDAFTTVYVSGTFNGWSGDANALSDDDLDGIWEATLSILPGTYEYKFSLDNWAADEALTEGSSCTVTNDGFTNRSLVFDDATVLNVVCWELCTDCSGLLQSDLPITWEGDEINYGVVDFGENMSTLVADPLNASNTVLQTDRSATAPTWAGTTLHTLSGLANPIPFDENNNVITVDVYSPIVGAVIRLKVEDKTDPTKSCETEAITTTSDAWETLTFDFTNEAPGTAEINYTYTFDMISIFYNFGVEGVDAGAQTYYNDNVYFGGQTATPYNVTFRVDMNDYTGDFTQVQLNGTFNGWCGDCNPMSDDDADGVWELTIPLEDESIEFKYTFDNWTGQEALVEGSECTVTNDGFTNRYLEITADTIMPVVCWNSCMECTGTPSSVDITFKVDMSEYTEAYSMVNLNGTFNGWCGDCAVMTDDDADDIYEITVNISTADTAEYKFTVDGWTDDEQLTEGDACTLTTTDDSGTFTNRFIVPVNDTTLSVVCWEYCVSCLSLGVEDENWVENFSVVPNPSQGTFMLNIESKSNKDITVNIFDAQGKSVFNLSQTGGIVNQNIDLSDVDNGIYYITVTSDLGSLTEKLMIIK